MSRLADIIYKRQNLLVPVAIFLICCAFAFSFNNGATKWFWNNYPFIAIILMLVAVLIAWLWAAMEKRKFQIAFDQLKNTVSGKPDQEAGNLDALSTKQKEVFDLIVQGKSNKEIMSELFIELSTLKTHINQIYKKLGISKRKEAQILSRTMDKGN